MREREDDRPSMIPDPLDQLLATSTINVPPRPALELSARVGRSVWSWWWLVPALAVVILSVPPPRSWIVPPLAALLVWTATRRVVLLIAAALWSGVLGIGAVYLGNALGSAPPPSARTPFTRRS